MLKHLTQKLGKYPALQQYSDFAEHLCSTSIVPRRWKGHFFTGKLVCVNNSDSKLVSSSSMTQDGVRDELNLLKGLDLIHINQTRIIGEKSNVYLGSGLSLIEMEVRTRKNLKILNIEFQKGPFPEDFFIKMYNLENETYLAFMYLQSCINSKSVILRVTAPPGNLVASIYEVRGISSVALVEDKNYETAFQLLTNGGFGWTTSAKILTPAGDKKLGKMYKMKTQKWKESLCLTIHFPSTLDINSKVSLIGAGLILMGDIVHNPNAGASA